MPNGINLSFCLYWPESIKVYQLFIDGSFFVPYLFFILYCPFKRNSTLHCLSVWNVVKDHRATAKIQLFAESEYKGKAIFWTTKTFPPFF